MFGVGLKSMLHKLTMIENTTHSATSSATGGKYAWLLPLR